MESTVDVVVLGRNCSPWAAEQSNVRQDERNSRTAEVISF